MKSSRCSEERCDPVNARPIPVDGPAIFKLAHSGSFGVQRPLAHGSGSLACKASLTNPERPLRGLRCVRPLAT
jgi:hypothetical protein